MAENFLGISQKRITVFGLAHGGSGKSGQLINAKLVGNLTKPTKCAERQRVIIALNATGCRNGFAQPHKSAFIINGKRRARRAAKADKPHRIGTDIKHPLRGIRGQAPQLAERRRKLLGCQFLHNFRLPAHSPSCKDLPRPDRLGLVMK